MTALRFRYQTIEFDGDLDVHVRTLRDNQQFADEAGEAQAAGIGSATWPHFGVLWQSGQVLARIMSRYDIAGLKILEVGCGIGLTSLVLNERMANITATDHHPEVGGFLEENVRINSGRTLPFVRAGWGDLETNLGRFDLIVGSDLLYEDEHVPLLSAFVDRHARRCASIIIVDPGRGHRARFTKRMVGLGFSHAQEHPASTGAETYPLKMQVLTYRRGKL